jgi:STAM-binding protein
MMTRYVSLFTRVIWGHPEAQTNSEVNRCRAKAIEYLHSMPTLRSRMYDIWVKGQWTAEITQSSSRPIRKIEPAKYPSPDAAFVPMDSSAVAYPKFDEPLKRSASPTTNERFSYPALSDTLQLTPQEASRASTPTARLTVPFDLPETFQRIAHANTSRGIETCGVLLGFKQEDSALITTIVVPKQTGTRDTCEALPGAEEQILSYALSNELVCLGWIHTHPTQSCFLSSIDLHTTLPYQQMLADAVAIVIAPTDSKLPVGIFRLTQSGLSHIRKCPKRGFHSHDAEEALTTVVRDVNWDTTSKTVVVDHRIG